MSELDPEVAALLAKEALPAPSSAAKDRVFARVLTAVANTDAIEADADISKPSGTAQLGQRLLPHVLTFVVGAGVGGAVGFALAPRKETPVYVERASIPSAPAPVATELPLPSPHALPSATSRPVSSARSFEAPETDTSKTERALIEEARATLVAGDPALSLAKLDAHARRFPKARFAEEREALAIQALVNLTRADEAKARAAAFRERWPTSVYLPAVDATLRSIP